MVKIFRFFVVAMVILGINACNKVELDPMAEYVFFGKVLNPSGYPVAGIEVTCRASGTNIANVVVSSDAVGEFLVVQTAPYPTTNFKFKFKDIDGGNNGAFETLENVMVTVSDDDFVYFKKKGFFRGRCEKSFQATFQGTNTPQ